LANQKQELPVAAMLMTDWDEMSNLYRGPSIDASYQVSFHLALRSINMAILLFYDLSHFQVVKL
jgi:hypothetical protein